jgi:hypothetical protein
VSGRHEWLSRDPIQEQSGLNLYDFVANNPISQVDSLGEDFIAIGTKAAFGFLPVDHLSIEYYTEPSKTTQEGFRFNGEQDVLPATRTGAYELEPSLSFGHLIDNAGDPPLGIPPGQMFVPVSISFIVAASAATSRIVIYADGSCGGAVDAWGKIAAAAASYPYAEHGSIDTQRALQNWPNSMYQLPPGNNSNTFIREMARAIGRDADVIGGNHPGAIYPQPVPNPGYTPVHD